MRRLAAVVALGLMLGAGSPAFAWDWPSSGARGSATLAALSDWFHGSVLQASDQTFIGYLPNGHYVHPGDPAIGTDTCPMVPWDGSTCLSMQYFPNLDGWKCNKYREDSRGWQRTWANVNGNDTRIAMCLGSAQTPYWEAHTYVFNGEVFDVAHDNDQGSMRCPIATIHEVRPYVRRCAGPATVGNVDQATAQAVNNECRTMVLDGTLFNHDPYCYAAQQ